MSTEFSFFNFFLNFSNLLFCYIQSVFLRVLAIFDSGTEQMSDVGSDPGWAVVGVEPLYGNTLLVDQELGEVPGDSLCEPALLLLLQVLEQRNGIVAIHLYLGEQVKLTTFFLPYKMFNLTVVARLLPTKLVAGEGENGEIW